MIHRDIVNRYDQMLSKITSDVICKPQPGTEPCHLRWMLAELPLLLTADKANRWLGFIQACIILQGLTDVQTERDFTRPYFA